MCVENKFKENATKIPQPWVNFFIYLRKLTLPDRGPIRRFAFVMVGVRGSLVGPEADATLFTVQTLRMGKTTMHARK